MTSTPPLSEDILFGAAAIAEFVFGSSDSKAMRRVYYMVDAGHIPVARKGRHLIGRKSAISEAFAPEAA